jgi:hypothetical protein
MTRALDNALRWGSGCGWGGVGSDRGEMKGDSGLRLGAKTCWVDHVEWLGELTGAQQERILEGGRVVVKGVAVRVLLSATSSHLSRTAWTGVEMRHVDVALLWLDCHCVAPNNKCLSPRTLALDTPPDFPHQPRKRHALQPPSHHSIQPPLRLYGVPTTKTQPHNPHSPPPCQQHRRPPIPRASRCMSPLNGTPPAHALETHAATATAAAAAAASAATVASPNGNSTGMNGKAPRARRKTFNMGDSDNDNTIITTTTITTTSTPVVRKRRRGYSLRSNILLRPRRLSIPLPPHHTIVVNASGGAGGDASKDSSDSEDSDWDGQEDYDSDDWDDGDDTTANTEMLEVEYRVRPVVQQGDPTETMFWGWVVLASTWVVFVVGMGSVLGVWEWAWGVDTKVSSWTLPSPRRRRQG